jgi:hypothetical protein
MDVATVEEVVGRLENLDFRSVWEVEVLMQDREDLSSWI